MLSYTFSTREKILLGLLALVGIGIVWYQFVFVNVQNQIMDLDTQITATQDEFTQFQTRLATLETMKETVAQYKAQGLEPVAVPKYDNTQNLMAYLNGVLGGTANYTISFSDPTTAEDGTIHRSGTISYGCGSYEEARAVAQAIARGPYPCKIDALGISDGTKGGRSTNNAPVSANAQVTFFEDPTGTNTKDVKKDDGIPEGNDWSVYKEVTS